MKRVHQNKWIDKLLQANGRWINRDDCNSTIFRSYRHNETPSSEEQPKCWTAGEQVCVQYAKSIGTKQTVPGINKKNPFQKGLERLCNLALVSPLRCCAQSQCPQLKKEQTESLWYREERGERLEDWKTSLSGKLKCSLFPLTKRLKCALVTVSNCL